MSGLGLVADALEGVEVGEGLGELSHEVGFVADDLIGSDRVGQEALVLDFFDLLGDVTVGGALGVVLAAGGGTGLLEKLGRVASGLLGDGVDNLVDAVDGPVGDLDPGDVLGHDVGG